MAQAELAWAEGKLRTSELHLEKSLEYTKTLLEIETLRFESGFSRGDVVVRANEKKQQTDLAIVRLRQFIDELKAAGLSE